ncbi:MAG: hypothetical protein HPY57_13190 [Ignavibacteria bacterium]|nr:hypothetical protein [Ignavibacteria bacterium]
MKVKDLDKSLSLKLGDPVDNCSDGKIFSWQDRLGYLRRAYSRLRRNLKWLMRSYAPKFAKSLDYIEVDNVNSTGQNIKVVINDKEVILTNVYELYATIEIGGEKVITNCKYVNPESFLSIKYGKNINYKPVVNSEEQNVFFTIFSNSIYLLPEGGNFSYERLEIILEQDTVLFSDPEEEVNIPNDYVDMFIEYAANEGMQDLGRSDKFQLYTVDMNNQLASAKAFADLLETKEGSNINDR